MLKNIYKPFLLVLGLMLAIVACTEEEDLDDQTFSSDEFRVLKVSEGDERLVNGDGGVSAFQLSLQVAFSHSVDPNALAGSLNVSGNPTYSITYDSSNSIANLNFEALEYETEYTLSLPAGIYGTEGQELKEEYKIDFKTRPFVIPTVTLSTDNESPEEGGSTVVTANISAETTEEVKVGIELTGTASSGDDFVLASNEIIVPIGSLSGSVTINITDDDIIEGNENIEVNITTVENGNKAESSQPLFFTVLDNDVNLTLKGVFAIRWATEPDGNAGKAIHLRATADITDLSEYSIGVANNGGGTDSVEYTFPPMAVAQGEDVLLARNDGSLLTYLDNGQIEFEHVIQSDAMSQNGNDAIELFSGSIVIETYGDADVDGVGMPWEYTGSWAYKIDNKWRTGGVDCAESSTTSVSSNCTYPLVAADLLFKGAMEIETDSELRIRAYHFEALESIADLSAFRVEIFNNGNTAPAFAIVNLPSQSATEGEDILVVRDSDAEDVGPYFGTCAERFTIYESTEVTSNGDDALVFFENSMSIDTLGTVGVDGSGEIWEYANGFGYRNVPGADFNFSGAGCTNAATSNSDASCFYPFCE